MLKLRMDPRIGLMFINEVKQQQSLNVFGIKDTCLTLSYMKYLSLNKTLVKIGDISR